MTTISQRLRGITELSDDGYEGISKLSTEFKRIADIDIYDAQGQLRGTYDILKDMAEVFPTLNKNQQQYLAELAAGKRQVTVLQSLLGNWESVDEAVKNATNATGSAMAENEKFLDSVEGKVNQLQSAWQNFSRKSIDSNWIKNILSTGTSIIKLFDNMGNVLLVLGGIILTIKIPTLSNNLKTLKGVLSQTSGGFKNLLSIILKYPAAAKMAKVQNTTLAASYESLGVSANIAQLAVGLLTAALTAGILIYNKVKQSKEAAKQAAIEGADAALSEVESLQSLKKEYISILDSTESETEKNKQLTSFKEKLVEQYGLEKDAVDKLNDSRQEGINLLNQEMKVSVDKGISELGDEYEEAKNKIESGTQEIKLSRNIVMDENSQFMSDLVDVFTKLGYESEKGYSYLEGTYIHASMATKDLIDQQEKLGNSITELRQKEQSRIGLTQAEITALDMLQNQYDSNKKTIDKYQETYNKGNELYAQNILLSNQASIANVTSKESFDEFKNSILEQAGASEGLKNALSDLVDGIFPQFVSKSEEATEYIQKNNISFENLSKTLGELETKYEILYDAVDEFNENGAMSIDTFQKLIDNDLLDYLTWTENGLRLNESALQDAADAAKQDALNSLQDAYAKDVLALASGNLDEMSTGAKNAIEAEKKQINGLGQKAQDQVAGVFNLATANAALQASLGGDAYDASVLGDKLNKINSYYNNLAKGISGLSIKTSSTKSSGNKKSSSGSKSTKDTWKEQFEKEYNALKHQLNMNEITEKEYTDRLEVMYKKYFSDKSKYLDEYNKYEEEVYKNRKKLMEDEIDELEKVLKKQRELAEDKYDNAVKVATNAIDERIEALKKQKEALEENNDEQERAIELAKLQDELERAKTQKTMRVFYADRGWVKLCPAI